MLGDVEGGTCWAVLGRKCWAMWKVGSAGRCVGWRSVRKGEGGRRCHHNTPTHHMQPGQARLTCQSTASRMGLLLKAGDCDRGGGGGAAQQRVRATAGTPHGARAHAQACVCPRIALAPARQHGHLRARIVPAVRMHAVESPPQSPPPMAHTHTDARLHTRRQRAPAPIPGPARTMSVRSTTLPPMKGLSPKMRLARRRSCAPRIVRPSGTTPWWLQLTKPASR